MNNLLKLGISQDTIDKMIDSYNITIVNDLNVNYEKAFRILNGLKAIEIKDEIINQILINRIDLFTMDYNKFVNKLVKYDLKEFDEEINFDIGAVEDIFYAD